MADESITTKWRWVYFIQRNYLSQNGKTPNSLNLVWKYENEKDWKQTIDHLLTRVSGIVTQFQIYGEVMKQNVVVQNNLKICLSTPYKS